MRSNSLLAYSLNEIACNSIKCPAIHSNIGGVGEE